MLVPGTGCSVPGGRGRARPDEMGPVAAGGCYRCRLMVGEHVDPAGDENVADFLDDSARGIILRAHTASEARDSVAATHLLGAAKALIVAARAIRKAAESDD